MLFVKFIPNLVPIELVAAIILFAVFVMALKTIIWLLGKLVKSVK